MRQKVLIAGRHDFDIMGEKLQLENLAQELARNLNIALSDKPKDNVAEAVTYWKTGSNGRYTLDHTIVNDRGSYTVILEEVKLASQTKEGCGKEHLDASVISLLGKTEFHIRYHGQTVLVDWHKERIRKLTPNSVLQKFYDFAKLEMANVEGKKAAGDQSECFDFDFELEDAQGLKALPKFVKEFYG